MNAIEAMQALKDGKKIRKRHWRDRKIHIQLNKNGQIVDPRGDAIAMNTYNLVSDEWELYDDTEYFDFFEAIKRIKEGKKVSTEDVKGPIYKLDRAGHTILLDGFGDSFSFIRDEITSNRWYEVE